MNKASTTALFLRISILMAASNFGCGLSNEDKTSCATTNDCIEGYVCNTATQTCEVGLTPDAGGVDASSVIDAPIIDIDACIRDTCGANVCGLIDDGCGGTRACGGCPSPSECDDSGEINQCVCTGEPDNQLCATSPVQCGPATLVDQCGDARTVDCGGCSGDDQCNIWSAGLCNTIVCTASNWCRALGSQLTSYEISGLWGDGTRTWIAGSNISTDQSEIFVRENGAWTKVVDHPNDIRALAGLGNRVWTAADSGELGLLENGSVTQQYGNSSLRWSGLAVTSHTDIWAAGYSDTSFPWAYLAHYNGTGWNVQSLGGTFDVGWRLQSISAASWNDIWVVGASTGDGSTTPDIGPLMFHYNGISWDRVFNPPTSRYLMDVWANRSDDVWAVGWDGVILHWDGQTWSQIPSGVNNLILLAVHGVGDDVWVAGENGILLRYVDGTWQPQQSGTTRAIYALWANSPTDVWAAGEAGTLLHFQP